MQTATMNPAHVYNAIRIFHPAVLEEIKPKLAAPQPVFVHAKLLPALLKRFCELKGITEQSVIGIRQGKEMLTTTVKNKTLFIAVIVKLYDPQLLTFIHTKNLKDNLRKDLSKLLKTHPTWISQIINHIRQYLNPHKSLPAYDDFKNEVNKIAKVFEQEF